MLMSEKWIKDTGLVAALLLLFLGYGGKKSFLLASGLFLLVSIIFPRILTPLAYVWLQIANSLNGIVPKLLFGLVFFLIILPMGLIRKLFGADPLMFNRSKQLQSAFIDRKHRYEAVDLETPY